MPDDVKVPEVAVKTLAQKILDIQANVPTVKKKGFNKEHQYKFLQIEDAVTAVNKMLSSRDLILTQDLAKRPDGTDHWETVPHASKGYIAKVVLCWTLEDVITKESRVYRVAGEGYDTTDKGTPKAITASRKQAIITIFNLPVGDNPEAHSPAADRESAKNAAQGVAAKKIAEAAGRGSQAALDALSQIEPEKKVKLERPQEYNAHYIKVSGFLAVPVIDTFLTDVAAKRFPAKGGLPTYWRVAAEYERGLLTLCERLQIEVDG